jgi:hypothetical protein
MASEDTVVNRQVRTDNYTKKQFVRNYGSFVRLLHALMCREVSVEPSVRFSATLQNTHLRQIGDHCSLMLFFRARERKQ